MGVNQPSGFMTAEHERLREVIAWMTTNGNYTGDTSRNFWRETS